LITKVDINLITQALTLKISRHDITTILRNKNKKKSNDELIKNKIQTKKKTFNFQDPTIQDSNYLRGNAHSGFSFLVQRNPKINQDELATAMNIGFSYKDLREMLEINPEIQIKEGLIKCKEENISEDDLKKILKINPYIDLSAVAKVVSIGFPLVHFLELLETNSNLDTKTLSTIADLPNVTVQDLEGFVQSNSTLDMKGLLDILESKNMNTMKTEDLKILLELTIDLKILKDAIDIGLEFNELKLILEKEHKNDKFSILEDILYLIKNKGLTIETLINSENLAKLIFFQIKEIDIKQEEDDVLLLVNKDVYFEDLWTLLDSKNPRKIDWETLKSAIHIGFTSKELITILKKQEVAVLKTILDLINKNDLNIEELRNTDPENYNVVNEVNIEDLKTLLDSKNARKIDWKTLKSAIHIGFTSKELITILKKQEVDVLKKILDLINKNALNIEELRNTDPENYNVVNEVNIEDLKTLLDSKNPRKIDWETLKSAIHIGFTSGGLITILKKQKVAVLKEILDLINKNDLKIDHETIKKHQDNLEILIGIVEFSMNTVERRI